MRVGIVVLAQESNSFLADRTTLEHFRGTLLATGDEVAQRFAGTYHEVAGFLASLAAADLQAVPIFAARAMPFGVVAGEAWDELMSMLWAALDRAAPLDGVLVAPAGATVSESEADADGFWLEQLRARLGPAIPIIGTLDPHANLSQRMVDVCDALVAYRTNPHIDQFATGLRAANLMARTLRGEIRPTQAAAFPPLSINVERIETANSPCRELLAVADRQLQIPGVLSNSVCFGFAYADVAEMGASTLAVTDDDPALAQQLADELAGYVWENRRHFLGQAISVDEAIQRTLQLEEPVCLLDTGDNIGGGSPGDGTWLIHALDRGGVARSLVCLVDPVAVAQCEAAGVGKTLRLSIGGRSGPLQGPPFETEVTIAELCDGDFQEAQPLHGGFVRFDQGRTAVLRTAAGLTLVVTSQRVPPFSLGQITRAGLNPGRFRVLVAKGVVAPVAAYRTVCDHFIRVATPGVATTDVARLAHEHRRRPLFPFESDFDWSPSGRREAAVL